MDGGVDMTNVMAENFPEESTTTFPPIFNLVMWSGAQLRNDSTTKLGHGTDSLDDK